MAARWTYTKGLHDLGSGAYAYLQPDGGWGWSNAGLVVDGDESLLVDTLFDLQLTGDMLAAMRAAEPKAAKAIGTVVNTHHNGDHCNGNELVREAEIIASSKAAAAMQEESPALLEGFMKAAPDLGEVGAYLQRIFGSFEFSGITQTLPTTTFDGHLTRRVGDKTLELIEVGPAHTAGDILVHIPADKTIFTGDILFIDGHPLVWAGPVSHWIEALDRIMGLDVETIVPGHGPITDKSGVERLRGYFVYIQDEARKRFAAGMDAFEAARDISFADYANWGDAERIAVNVDTLYREYHGIAEPTNIVELFTRMAQLAKDRP